MLPTQRKERPKHGDSRCDRLGLLSQLDIAMQQITPKLSVFKQQIFIISVSVDQESGHSLPRPSASPGVSHEAASKVLAELWSSQDSTGGESASSASRDCWQARPSWAAEALVPL